MTPKHKQELLCCLQKVVQAQKYEGTESVMMRYAISELKNFITHLAGLKANIPAFELFRGFYNALAPRDRWRFYFVDQYEAAFGVFYVFVNGGTTKKRASKALAELRLIGFCTENEQ